MVGTVALATDVGLLYFHWVRLQQGVDSAALAGAGYLPVDPNRAKQTAVFYAEANGIQEAELAGPPTIAPDASTITVTAKLRTSHGFLRAVGLYTGGAVASATAQAPFAPSTIGGGNGTSGNPLRTRRSSCALIGQCDLLPIGLDYRTPYVKNEVVTLNHQQPGPDNWSLLGLDGAQARDERAGVANGYPGPLSIGQQVPAEADDPTDAVAQGLSARITTGRSKFPNGTFSNHDPIDPRAIIVPMVDWEGGTNQARVRAFAALWVDSINGGAIQAHFIDQVAYDSPPDPNAPFRGARGRPILIR
jgi:hypothetical protein